MQDHDALDLRLLGVEVPALPPVQARSSADTARRLACNCATLFGVPWDGNPQSRTWVRRFDDLTLKEVARGSIDGEPVSEIAPATLNRFRPDRKAGATLAGARTLLESLLPPARDTLRLLAAAGDGAELHPEAVLIVWASIVQEAYRCQPALFVAAVTARLVQRALLRDWFAVIRGSGPTAEAPQVSPSPRTLPLLDTDGPYQLLDPLLGRSVSTSERRRTTVTYRRPDLVEKWVDHLLDPEAGGLAWTESRQGQLRVTAYTATTELLHAYLDEVVAGEVDQDASKSALLPHIPTPRELAALPPASRRLTVWCILQLHRVLREHPRYQDPIGEHGFRTRVTEDAAALAASAAAALHEDDPLIVLARARATHRLVVDLRERDPETARAHLAELRQDLDELVGRYEQGDIDGGAIADVIRSFSSIFNAFLTDAKADGDVPTELRIRDELRRDWEVFFGALQVPALGLTSARFTASGIGRALAAHLHNYAAFLSNSDRWTERQYGIDIETELVLPAREQLSARQPTERPVRLTLQVLLRLIDRQYSTTSDPAQRRALALRVPPLVERLLATHRGEQLLGSGEDRRLILGEIHTITAILTGAAVLSEEGVTFSLLPPHVTDRLGRLAFAALQELGRGAPSARTRDLRRLQDRIRGAAGPSSSADHPRPAP